jgi:hypothetical protein
MDHKTVNRWKICFLQQLNLQGVGVLGRHKYRQQTFVSETNISEVEVAIGKLKRYKSPGADQVPAEMIQAEGETLHPEIHKLS